MKKIYIIGAGGSGREVVEIIKDLNIIELSYEICGFIDDNHDIWGTTINGIKVLGGVDFLIEESTKHECYAVISIADCDIKEDIARRLNRYVTWENIVHPTAKIWSFVDIGHGNIIEPFVFVGPNAQIGNHVLINTKANIGHDSIIEDYSSIMCLCDITGNVHIEKKVYVASRVSVIPGLTVGKSAKLGAGAVIIKDVKPNVTMHGYMAVEATK